MVHQKHFPWSDLRGDDFTFETSVGFRIMSFLPHTGLRQTARRLVSCAQTRNPPTSGLDSCYAIESGERCEFAIVAKTGEGPVWIDCKDTDVTGAGVQRVEVEPVCTYCNVQVGAACRVGPDHGRSDRRQCAD